METMQSIRSRIKSVASTQQITNSMRLVSSAKIHGARAVFDAARPFYKHSISLMQQMAMCDEKDEKEYFGRRKQQDIKTAVVVVSTDRGLCGAYNMNLSRKTVELVGQKENCRVKTIGSKIRSSLKREGIEVDAEFIGTSERPLFEEAEMFAQQLLELYTSKQVDEVYVVYTSFQSVLMQQAVAEKLLPFVPQQEPEQEPEQDGIPKKKKPKKIKQLSFEPEYSEIASEIVFGYMSAFLYKALTEAALSEQSARVSSMDSAAKNSAQLVKKLTLQYNKRRQDGITGQLIEIVGGAEAQK